MSVLSLAFVCAQNSMWEESITAGSQALQEGRYAEAEKLFVAALEEAEKFGEHDSRLALSHLALGRVYQELGHYTQAEPIYKRGLAIQEKALGPEHPKVATSLNNLGFLYEEQGKYTLAEPPYQRALAIYEKSLGSEHLQVAQGLGNYADLLRKMDRDAEAEKMEARAEAIRAKHAQENPPN